MAELEEDEQPFFVSQSRSDCGRLLAQYDIARATRFFVERAKLLGAVLTRVTLDNPDEPRQVLFEAWRVHPKDQGEPRWMDLDETP